MAMLSIGESLRKKNDQNNYNTTYHYFSQCTQPKTMKRIELNTIHLKQETLQRDTHHCCSSKKLKDWMQPILELVKAQWWIWFIKVLKGGIRKKKS